MQDALKKDVVIGRTYGYTSSKGSLITVVIGRVRKLAAKKVTLDVLSRQGFLYGDPTGFAVEQAGHASVHACHLFPVPDPAGALARRTALAADIQRQLMANANGLNISQIEALRDAALDACSSHGFVPTEAEALGA